jgi:hypothetical protein
MTMKNWIWFQRRASRDLCYTCMRPKQFCTCK